MVKNTIQPQYRYNFSQVAILELTYVVNFGSELSVVSMLPAFLELTFGLITEQAGMVAASYAFMNLMSCPGGGLISDRSGSRKWTMAVLTAGIGIGYLLMSQLGSSWLLPNAVILTMACSFFVQAGEGSTFAIVPLIKRRVTGQIAGNVGAYGNVGAVCYLTLYNLLPEGAAGNIIFFPTLGITSFIVAFLCAFLLKEPADSFAEHHEGEREMPLSVERDLNWSTEPRHLSCGEVAQVYEGFLPQTLIKSPIKEQYITSHSATKKIENSLITKTKKN